MQGSVRPFRPPTPLTSKKANARACVDRQTGHRSRSVKIPQKKKKHRKRDLNGKMEIAEPLWYASSPDWPRDWGHWFTGHWAVILGDWGYITPTFELRWTPPVLWDVYRRRGSLQAFLVGTRWNASESCIHNTMEDGSEPFHPTNHCSHVFSRPWGSWDFSGGFRGYARCSWIGGVGFQPIGLSAVLLDWRLWILTSSPSNSDAWKVALERRVGSMVIPMHVLSM